MVCLPGGGHPLWGWKFVRDYVLGSGSSFLTYEFPREILSDQYRLTIDCFDVVSRTIREDIRRLRRKHHFKKCLVATLSLAGSFGSMVYKDNEDIDELFLIGTGNNLARVMWHGCRSQHLRKSYEKQGITLERLEMLWHDLSPENNMPAKETKVFIHFGEEDRVAPYHLSKDLPKTMESHGIRPKVFVYSGWGHYLVSLKLLLFPEMILGLTSKAS